MDDLIGNALVIVVFYVPILMILYFLSKTLMYLFSKINNSHEITIDKTTNQFLKTKIIFAIIGILYSICIFVGMMLNDFKPPWFHPPIWLKIVSIVFFVPYLACLSSLMGLGNIGRSGFSPWKDFKILINKIKKS